MLLCIATVALWVRSYVTTDAIYYQRYGSTKYNVELIIVGSSNGALKIGNTKSMWRFREMHDGFNYFRVPSADAPWPAEESGMRWLNFRYQPHDFHNETAWLYIPYWFLVLLITVSMVMIQRNRLRQLRRLEHGQCSRCGYDLRATPDRCPECGAVPAAAAR
jgi:hypothetical protein